MICLKNYSRYNEASVLTLELKERLPTWLVSPCTLSCSFFIQRVSDYYLFKFTLFGQIHVICQRCLESASVDYTYTGEVAICRTENRADELMSSYDCIVAVDENLDLEAVVVDELHLSSPQVAHSACHPIVGDGVGST